MLGRPNPSFEVDADIGDACIDVDVDVDLDLEADIGANMFVVVRFQRRLDDNDVHVDGSTLQVVEFENQKWPTTSQWLLQPRDGPGIRAARLRRAIARSHRRHEVTEDESRCQEV